MLASGPLDATGKVALQNPQRLCRLLGVGVRVARISGASFTPSWWLPEALPETPAQYDQLALTQLGPTRGGECPARRPYEACKIIGAYKALGGVH